MTPEERRSAVALAGIFSFRMLGLFMILPVFALYAENLAGVTPTLVGVAIGIYGLSQAALQIPFGMASDRIGRKPVIVFGLLLFAAGSVLAAVSTSIEGVIAGRALQGAGAVAAAIMALAADLTREEHRTKVMAVIGLSIGMSFLVAMVAGPLLDKWIGVPGIFWLTAVLALAGIAILLLLVPTPRLSRRHRDAEPVPAQFRQVLHDAELLRLDFGILILHLVLTASFVVLPLVLRNAGLAPADHWMLYLPVMALGMAAAVPFIIIGEKKRRLKQVVVGAVGVLAIGQLLLMEFHTGLFGIAVVMWVFFAAFNLLEATLPSLIAKTARADSKGTAMGVYSSSQFVGAFIGGAAGGAIHGAYGVGGVFAFCAALIALWLLAAATMRQPRHLATRVVNLGRLTDARAAQMEAQLSGVRGVAEVVVDIEDGIAYLKVDNDILDAATLNRYCAAG